MDPLEELLQNIEAALIECKAYHLGEEMSINTQPNLLHYINRFLEYVGCDTLAAGVEAMIVAMSHLHPGIPLMLATYQRDIHAVGV